MQKSSRSLAAAVAALVVASTALAYNPKDTAQQVGAPVTPIPSTVVGPTNLPQSFSRRVVEVEFSLDRTGQPVDIKVVSNTDRAVKQRVVQAFRQWKFLVNATEPVDTSKRFILPLDIVPEA